MPTEDNPSAPDGATFNASATPAYLPGPYGGLAYRVHWRAYLDNPRPTDALRRRGADVYVVATVPLEWGGEGDAEHRLPATSFGAPEPWDTVMVAIGAGIARPWRYGVSSHGPFVTNGHCQWSVPVEVIEAVAFASCTTELEGAAVDSMMAAAIKSSAEPARIDGRALDSQEANVVQVGRSWVAVRYAVAALHLGGGPALTGGPTDAVILPGLGVVMPVRMSDS